MKERVISDRNVADQTKGDVLVLYENTLTREQAAKLWEEFGARNGGDAGPEIQWFCFEDLISPDAASAVADFGAGAEVIVLALTADGDLPEHLKSWGEKWLGKRGEREGTLVGLVSGRSGNPCEIASFKEVYLRHLAHRAGMVFLDHLPAMARLTIPDSLDSFSARAFQSSALLDEIIHRPFVPPRMPL